MVIPCPKGEVYFRRAVLKNLSFNPHDLFALNNHVLIEWRWNYYSGGSHQRNYLQYVPGKYDNDKHYSYPRSLNVMFGEKGWEDGIKDSSGGRHASRFEVSDMLQVLLPGNTEECEKRDKGGPLKVVLTLVKIAPNLLYMVGYWNMPMAHDGPYDCGVSKNID